MGVQLNDRLKALIATAVSENATFGGKIGSVYTVQDLMHSVSQRSLDEMYKTIKKQISGLSDESLYASSNSSKKTKLEAEAELIKEIFAYNQAKLNAAKELENKKAMLATYKELKDKKEIEKMNNLSIEELEKEIAALES